MDDVVFTRLDASEPHLGWTDYAEDGGTKASLWASPDAPGWLIDVAIIGTRSSAPRFEVIGLRATQDGPGSEITFEHLGGDDPRFAWMDAHDGGMAAIWTARELPDGALQVTVWELREGVPQRIKVEWMDYRPSRRAGEARYRAAQEAAAERGAKRAAKRAVKLVARRDVTALNWVVRLKSSSTRSRAAEPGSRRVISVWTLSEARKLT